MTDQGSQAKLVIFPQQKKPAEKPRKAGLNRNRDGSVRKINGKVYVDFIYLGERVREPSGLDWNEKNAKTVREQLDRIIMAIKSGTFRFAEVFPSSKNRDHFSAREKDVYGSKTTPDQVLFKDYAWKWFNLLKGSGRVSGRTLMDYKSYLKQYLVPFFGEMSFARFNAHLFEEFVSWARERKLTGEPIGNNTMNKLFIPMKLICNAAAIEYRWIESFNPFFGFKRLQEDDPKEKLFPFSMEEQALLREHLPEHWRPYFDFAFRTGLRAGEQIGLKPDDIDWEKGLLHIRRAITVDADRKRIEGTTKNRYSRRTIKLTPAMIESLEEQRRIRSGFTCEYFFCTQNGCPVIRSNLRRNVWIPTLKRAVGVKAVVASEPQTIPSILSSF
jgi:integrase